MCVRLRMRARACAAVYPPPASCVTFVGLAAGLQLLGAEEEGRRMGRGGRLLPGRAAGRVRLAEELGGLRGDVVNTGDARTLSTSVVTDSCPSGATEYATPWLLGYSSAKRSRSQLPSASSQTELSV